MSGFRVESRSGAVRFSSCSLELNIWGSRLRLPFKASGYTNINNNNDNCNDNTSIIINKNNYDNYYSQYCPQVLQTRNPRKLAESRATSKGTLNRELQAPVSRDVWTTVSGHSSGWLLGL